MRDKVLLRQLQALPLDAKVLMTQQRIREWYNYWNGDVYISFSGGKDSTVLTHLVHNMYPDVPLVFANTGLEYPEIQAFARQMGAEFVRPKMSFSEVISKYGYPIIGKEIAEAISYARRIVLNSEGGGGTQKKKRTEMRGERIDRTSRTNRVEESESHREYSATQERTARNFKGKGLYPPHHKKKQRSNQKKIRHQREQIALRKIERFRKQLMGK